MSVLLIRLAGPMQSWGTKSRFYDRDTEDFPSKSGVLGIIGAALGRDRAEDISDLTSLKMGVRVINKGIKNYDYQVAGVDGFYRAAGNVERNNAIPYTKNYLASADFLVALEGNKELLTAIDNALKAPVYPLFLGRKSYTASKPIFVDNSITDKSMFQALLDFSFNKFIDADIIKILKRDFLYNNDTLKNDKKYSQIMIFDKDYNIENHKPLFVNTVQDVPTSFQSREYRLRDISVYNIEYQNSYQYLSALICPQKFDEKGDSNVPL
jgi:CRISPR system Cascade subunit CasD